MTWAVEQNCKNASQKLVLLMLANHTNGHTGQCNPSHKRLADECCMSVSSLKVQIKALEDLGYLKIIRVKKDGVNMPNQYILNLNGGGSDLGGVGQNLAEGGSESGYKTGIEPIPLYRANKKTDSFSQEPDNNAMNAEMQACFKWSQSHPFWQNSVTSISKFLELYSRNAPNGLRGQFEKSRIEANAAHGSHHYATHQQNNKHLSAVEQVRAANGLPISEWDTGTVYEAEQ